MRRFLHFLALAAGGAATTPTSSPSTIREPAGEETGDETGV